MEIDLGFSPGQYTVKDKGNNKTTVNTINTLQRAVQNSDSAKAEKPIWTST